MAISVGGYWDRLSGSHGPEMLEELHPGGTIRQAIQWGRMSANDVLIRNDNPDVDVPTGTYFWAGTGPRLKDLRT